MLYYIVSSGFIYGVIVTEIIVRTVFDDPKDMDSSKSDVSISDYRIKKGFTPKLSKIYATKIC